MKNKNLFLLITLFLCSFQLFAQVKAKKPSILIVPDAVWCINNGFFIEKDDQGIVKKYPDYERALLESMEANAVINTVAAEFNANNFQPIDLLAQLKRISEERAESLVAMSSGGGEILESPEDELARVANADIWVRVSWQLFQTGPRKSIQVTLSALDAYTSNSFANNNNTGNPSMTAEIPVLVKEAIVGILPGFINEMQNYFEELFENGRIIGLNIKVWNNWGYDLLTEDFGDDELGFLIQYWMEDNSVNGNIGSGRSTDTQMDYRGVRIPMTYERNGRERALDARTWGNNLRKYLQELGIESKLTSKGLGEVRIILGEK